MREIKRLVLLLQRFVTGDVGETTSSRHSGLTRPGGSTSSSDSSSTPSPATASISARVSVQGGSALTGSSSRRTTWTTSAVAPGAMRPWTPAIARVAQRGVQRLQRVDLDHEVERAAQVGRLR